MELYTDVSESSDGPYALVQKYADGTRYKLDPQYWHHCQIIGLDLAQMIYLHETLDIGGYEEKVSGFKGKVTSIKRDVKEMPSREGCRCFVPGESYEVVVKYKDFQSLIKDFSDSEFWSVISPPKREVIRQNAEGVGGQKSSED